jgi:hypothetical protein
MIAKKTWHYWATPESEVTANTRIGMCMVEGFSLDNCHGIQAGGGPIEQGVKRYLQHRWQRVSIVKGGLVFNGVPGS